MYSVVSLPIGLFRIQNYLKKSNITCDVLDLGLVAPDINDGNTESIDIKFGDYSKLIDEGYYDIIGVSVDQENMDLNLKMLWDLRQKINKLNKKCFLVAGGQAATHGYEQWLVEGSLDAVFFGFAEKSFLKFCEN